MELKFYKFNPIDKVTCLTRDTSLKVFEGSIDCKRCDISNQKINTNLIDRP